MKLLISAALLCSICYSLHAQVLQAGLISTSGGFSTSSNGSLSWTLGELAIQTFKSGDQQLTQGFHQNRMLLTPVFEVDFQAIELDVFPNPSSQIITLRTSETSGLQLSYELLNVYGQQLRHGSLEANNTTIDLSQLSPQLYLLNVISSYGKKVAVFKIQKID